MAIKRNKSRQRSTGHGGTGDWDKLTPLQEALLKEAAREITIASNGRSDTVRMDEVVTRKMMQMAANGGQHSIGNAIYQINMAQRLKQKKIDEEVELGWKYKAHQQRLLDGAIRQGSDLDTVLPHPDDIVVEEGAGFEVLGPSDRAELSAAKRDCERRDAAILQAALEERLGTLPSQAGRKPSADPPDQAALVLANILNNALPRRFQKSNLQMTMDLMRYQGLPKRELLKRAHQNWAALGQAKPRGWRLPPAEALVSSLQRVLPAMMALYPEVKASKLSAEAITVRLQRMIGPTENG